MVGSVLSNRYELLENIGAGGMAIVYRARCRLLNRNVAVKILRPEFQEDEDFLKRFTIEAQAAASLSHPNVVSIYDVGHHGKLNYIVMECIEGITLKEYMTKKGSLSINEATDFTMQIASALEHAHSKGIIHRDIKPHNIIITNDGVLKVTDFGLARAVSKTTTVAGGGAAIGSVHYVSPEQARGGFTDERTDIYSLGVVMYEMFTGQLPFDSDTPVAVAMKHLQETATLPSVINQQIPQAIEAIIMKALEKDVKNRYATVSDLIADMRKAVGDEDIIAHTDKFSTKKLPKLQDVPAEKVPDPPKKKKEDTVAIVAAIVTAVAVIVALAVVAAKWMFPSDKRKIVEIETPSLINMSIDSAREMYKDLQIEEYAAEYSSTIPEGFIIEQDKEPGTKMMSNGRISVTVSRGSQKIELDDFSNQDYRVIERKLQEMGLVPQISEENSDSVREGYIIRHNPSAGYTMRTGDTVVLYVSKGKSDVEVAVPTITGKSEQEARDILRACDLKAGNVDTVSNGAEKGTVVMQSIASGTMVSTGTAIDFSISNGKADAEKTEGKYTLRVELPQDKETVQVKITDGDNVLVDDAFETALSPITLNLRGEVGESTINIYVDGVPYKENVPVNFS
ncbi:MAG: Stk1 family PASTA domain-containing Ser/Thr kinase [Clostridia bacterium]|nr:Stk1 family PASTA domain-containing Ser/Thr kinase [Clostridia bacterium]